MVIIMKKQKQPTTASSVHYFKLHQDAKIFHATTQGTTSGSGCDFTHHVISLDNQQGELVVVSTYVVANWTGLKKKYNVL